jgi:hypothetical protein
MLKKVKNIDHEQPSRSSSARHTIHMKRTIGYETSNNATEVQRHPEQGEEDG